MKVTRGNFRGRVGQSVGGRFGGVKNPGGFDARMILNRTRKGGVKDLSEKLTRSRQQLTTQGNPVKRRPMRLNPGNNPIFRKTIMNDLVGKPTNIHNFKIRIPNDRFAPGTATSSNRSASVNPVRKLRVSVTNTGAPQTSIRRLANPTTFTRSLQQLQRVNKANDIRPTTSRSSAPVRQTVNQPPTITGSHLSETKVAVANLHPEVTEDDIVELFGSAGALKSAKLLRPGTAEVVFFTAKEAIKAIEMYDRRELDGLPMQCSLVSVMARPESDFNTVYHGTGLRSSKTSSFPTLSKRNETAMDVDELPIPSGSKELIPDRGLISEVLFNKNLNSRPVTFTVKV